ncbi:MAG: hypothetical protein SR3Q1_03800 [Quinella sp. 3Q1]|nr:hypothetical protein [Quinella sp. 3Q1]MBR3050676.1 hypothetical protein [Selenomonadaceae bacterium]MBR6888726.1 hypothetical protein [Selenomonadaceae bacterium]
MEKFQLSQFTREGAKLLRDVIDEFNRLGVDASSLPKTFPDDSGNATNFKIAQQIAGVPIITR